MINKNFEILESNNYPANIFDYNDFYFEAVINYLPLIYIILSLIIFVFFSSLIVWKNDTGIKNFKLNKQLTRMLLLILIYILIINQAIIYYISNKTMKSNTIFFGNENFLVHALIVLFFILFLIYARDYLIKHNSEISIEFPILFLLSYLGMLIMISTKELFIIFLSLEIMSFSFYTLAGYRSKRFFLQTEGSLKYFIIGSIASSLFIFGLSLAYISYGTVDFNNILSLLYFTDSNIGYFGLLLILIAISFKLGIAPFHVWLPEVYYSSTSVITFFFLLLPKIPLIYLLNMINLINFNFQYSEYLLLIFFLTFLMGTLSALRQSSLDKFLAYSAIANNGWFLLVISCQGNDSFLWFYIFVYSLITILIYSPVLLLRKVDNTRLLINLRDLLLLKKTNTTLSILFTLAFFSLAGIPPFLGFFSKFFLLLLSIDNSYYFLTIIAIIFSIFSCYYYIRMIKIIYFSSKLRIGFQRPLPIVSALLISIISYVNMFFLFFPKTLILLFYII